jgi:transposase
MKITTMGLDLAKAVFQIHGTDSLGRVVVRKQIRRSQLMQFFVQLEPCLVGMEACGSAHHWARRLRTLGHEVRLIPPQYVKPYVKSNKTDAADAEAICEAVQKPNMHFVPIKTVEQQSILSVHRVRTGFMKARIATSNQIRGLLAEFGMVLPAGNLTPSKVREVMIDQNLPGSFERLIELELDHLREVEGRLAELQQQIEAWHRESDASCRLAAIPGVGVLTATAVVASVGDARQFRNSRQMAAWIGLVPKQHSTGGKPRLLGISKRGDTYLRTLLIHGGRSVLRHSTAPEAWHNRLVQRRHKNVAAVAIANKNARTIWALLAKDRNYDPLQRLPHAVA